MAQETQAAVEAATTAKAQARLACMARHPSVLGKQ